MADSPFDHVPHYEFPPDSDIGFAEILDACCGGRMWWWDKNHPLACYVDHRERPAGTIPQKPLWKVAPDVVADFRDLPFADGRFRLVVFDPPHQSRSRAGTGINAEQYGSWAPGERDAALRLGFEECWRVLAPGGTLVFKWAGRVTEVQETFPAVPVVGTRPRGRKDGPTWVIFYKPLAERGQAWEKSRGSAPLSASPVRTEQTDHSPRSASGEEAAA